MLQGSQGLRDAARGAVDTAPAAALSPMQEGGARDSMPMSALPHVQGSGAGGPGGQSPMLDGTTDPITQSRVSDVQEVGQPKRKALVVPVADEPGTEAPMEDLSLAARRVDGDSVLTTPFNTSAAAVLRLISEAYGGDAYFEPGNEAEWGRAGIVRGDDRVGLLEGGEDQHATNEQQEPKWSIVLEGQSGGGARSAQLTPCNHASVALQPICRRFWCAQDPRADSSILLLAQNE